MNKFQILDRAKKKKIINEINEFGIKRINELLIRWGEEEIKAFSGSLSREEISELKNLIPIVGIGVYFGKELIDKRNGQKEFQLSLDALHILENQINGRILFLDEEQEKIWFFGENFKLNDNQILEFKKGGYVAVKSKESDDFIGVGKVSKGGELLYNLLPKDRRRKVAVIN